jgi:hypothetical protein
MARPVNTMAVKTALTGVVAAAWFGTYVMQAVNPGVELGMAPDAIMTTTVGAWLNAKRKDGDDKAA